MSRVFRWVGRNLSTLLLALIMAVIVWVSAVTSADPNQEQEFAVSVDIVGLASDLEITSELPEKISITVLAPRSILDQISEESGTLNSWMDLSELGAGTHIIPLHYQIAGHLRPVRVTQIDPATTEQTIEALISKTLPIQTNIAGEPTLGYQASDPEWSHGEVIVSGRSSQVEQVVAVKATLNISGAEETIERNIKITAEDETGNLVPGVIINPSEVTVVQTITLRGGYRNMVVKVLTEGQVADGYRQTGISVSPPNVMVFSADPAIVDQLPGYVETEPLMLTDAVDDFETSVVLELPENVSIIGDSNVLVEVGIAAMEGNLKIIRMVEVIGALPEYQVSFAPDRVEVILFGPLPELDTLTETDVRVVLDLADREAGIYQLVPEVIILPERIRSESLSPNTIEVEIIPIEELTPTPSITPTPTPTITATPTFTAQP
jgi:YbbR domain-containing protein